MTNNIDRGELLAVQDLQREGQGATVLVEQFEAIGRLIKSWATGLPERYAAAPFGTANLTKAVNGVAQHHRQASALREQLTLLQRACAEARALGEHVGAVGAEGSTRAYSTQ